MIGCVKYAYCILKALGINNFQSCYFNSYTYNFCQIINNIPSYGPTHYHHLLCHNSLWYSYTLANLYTWGAQSKRAPLHITLLSMEKYYTANIYYETTTKLQHKCFSLDFTTTDRSILQIVVLLKGHLLQLKVPASSSSMFKGLPGFES